MKQHILKQPIYQRRNIMKMKTKHTKFTGYSKTSPKRKNL